MLVRMYEKLNYSFITTPKKSFPNNNDNDDNNNNNNKGKKGKKEKKNNWNINNLKGILIADL